MYIKPKFSLYNENYFKKTLETAIWNQKIIKNDTIFLDTCSYLQ